MTKLEKLAKPNHPLFRSWWLLAFACCIQCNAASISRIGPEIPKRSQKCEIAVLEPGQKPTRPYRDVGVVSLSHCQDYRIAPCREWLRRAACRLGGRVAYLDDYKRPTDPDDGVVNQVTFHVLVATYIADLYPNMEDDPVYRSRACNPPCVSGMRCIGGTCKSSENNCDAGTETPKSGVETETPQKCLD